MERMKQVLHVVGRAIRTRVFAACAMAVVTVMLMSTVSISARAVTVSDGVDSRVILTLHTDPYKAVEKAGMQMYDYDLLHVNNAAASVDIDRAMTIEITADGVSTLIYMTGGTVADALSRADITVGKYDTMNVAADTPLEAGMHIVINRVEYQDYTRTETIEYTTETTYSFTLAPGRTKVLQQGSNGVRTVTYRQTIIDGRVVETNEVGQKITTAAVTRRVLKGAAYGTPRSAAPNGIQLDSKNQPVNYKTVYKNKSCTAYSIGKRGASGMRLGVGTVAVNPKIIPYGTKLWIVSADGKQVYGYAVAADTGSFANGNKTFCDLYMGSYTEACLFGRRSFNIYVIG